MATPQTRAGAGHKLPPKQPTWCHLHTRELAALSLILLVLATFWPALSNGFVGYDDPEYVTGNPHIQQGLSWDTLKWAFSNTDAAVWHPLVWLSHTLDYQCFGLRPWGHHLTGILLHAVDAALLLLVLHQLTGALARSWAVAAIFAVHTLRVESVAWVSERKDVLSMLFFLLTLWAYIRYLRTTSPGSAGVPPAAVTLWSASAKPGTSPASTLQQSGFFATRLPQLHGRFFLGLSLLFFCLGLMSKPMLVTVPFLLLLLDAWPLGRWSRPKIGRLLVEKIPFFVAAGLASAVTLLAQPHGTATMSGLSLLVRLQSAIVSYCWYLAKIFWPTNLAPFYPPVHSWPAMALIGSALLLISITLIAASNWRRRPYLLVGWLWFLAALLPVIGLIPIGDQTVADRYSYLPSIGICLGLVWTTSEITARWHFRSADPNAVLGAFLVVCIALTRLQVSYWKDSETLFRHTLAVTLGNYLAHNDLGVAFAQEGRWPDAIHQYHLALQIKPAYPEALKNIAVALEHQGQLDKAAECYERALQERPSFVAARNGLGLVYQKQGRHDLARQQFQLAIQVAPEHPDAHFNLALELEDEGQLERATAELQITRRLQPHSADVLNNLGVVLEKQGKLDAAVECYLSAIRLNPDFARAHYNLGVVLANKGLIPDAISEFEAALRLKPDYPAARTNLNVLKSLTPASARQQ